MIAPRWVSTRCQPIGIRDVIAYLLAALDLDGSSGRIFEIGGSDVLSYRDMMLRYAATRGLARKLFVVPLFTPRLSSYWVHLVTPIPASIARALIDGLHNEVVVRDGAARAAFPLDRADRVRRSPAPRPRPLTHDRPPNDLVRRVRRPHAAGRIHWTRTGHAHRPSRAHDGSRAA
jgi:hypothetical protein